MPRSLPTAGGSGASAAAPPNSRFALFRSNLALRILTAAVAIPVLAAAIVAGDPWFLLVVLAAGLAAAAEFNGLAERSGVPGYAALTYPGTALLILSARDGWQAAPLILTALLLLAQVWSVIRFQGARSVNGWVWTLAAVLYTGWLLGYYVALRGHPDGAQWVLLALFTTFASDTAAYATGRAVGRRRMAPAISPGKTWEGAAGGLAGGAAGGLLLGTLLGLPGGGLLLVLGGAVSVAAQLGDLAESALKRAAGVKESGVLVPGHGGILDRLDSLVFVGGVVYYYSVWVAART